MALDVLKKKSWASGAIFVRAGFADAVGDLGDFEDRVSFGTNFAKLAGTVERGDPVAKIGVGQESGSGENR